MVWVCSFLDTPAFTLWAGYVVKDSVPGRILIFQEIMLPKRAVESGCSGPGTFRGPHLELGPTWPGGAQNRG